MLPRFTHEERTKKIRAVGIRRVLPGIRGVGASIYSSPSPGMEARSDGIFKSPSLSETDYYYYLFRYPK
jgi:hypothetical protein